jgi:hypothetical protein
MAARTPVVIVDGIRTSLPDADSVDGLVTTAELAARVPDTPVGPTTKYLRGDYTWQTVSGGSGLTQPQVMARGLGV